MRADTMSKENEKDGKKMVIVVLDGIKTSTEKNGVAPLRCALRDVVGAEDEVLVLTIFNTQAPTPSPNPSCCLGDKRNNHPAGGKDTYIKFLQEEISLRMETYKKIFRPFYDQCRSSGVKLVVKIADGYRLPRAIIVEEANNARATWIVMDWCFASDNSFLLSGTNCTISLVDTDNEQLVMHNYMPPPVGWEDSVVREVKPHPICSKLKRKPRYQQEEPPIYCTLPNLGSENEPFHPSLCASTSTETEFLTKAESSDESESFENVNSPTNGTVLDDIGMPLQLSWEVISEITGGFRNIIRGYQNESFQMYGGSLTDIHSGIFVKVFRGDFSGILKTEKKAALSMHHKNIMGLIGYHQNENATALVFPATRRSWTLDRFLNGTRGKQQYQLTFHDKMNIAIGIAQGLRYMHEECPPGPIVHGDLRPCNIFVGYDWRPQITGFGQATWLQLQLSPFSYNRCWYKDHLGPESPALLKSDVLSFGILLLRLFCRRSAPQDDKELVEWARPLLLQRAYHKLLDEEMEYLDMYGIFKVMSAAAQCIKTKLMSRPCMSEVVSFLKGETSCAVQSSPSSEGSPNVYFNMVNL